MVGLFKARVALVHLYNDDVARDLSICASRNFEIVHAQFPNFWPKPNQVLTLAKSRSIFCKLTNCAQQRH